MSATLAVPAWIPVLVTLAWIAKDLLAYPLVRHYYESAPPHERMMLGERCEAMTRLAPGGQVRVHGEIWQASLVDRGSAVERGGSVRVRGLAGLTLLVELDPHPHRESAPDTGRS